MTGTQDQGRPGRSLSFRTPLRWAVLAVVAVLVIHILKSQPSEVEVVYVLEGAARDLKSATMRYVRGKEELRRVRFRYGGRPAGRTQAHRVRLPDGEFTVVIELGYAGEVPGGLARFVVRSNAEKQQVVVLHRPLFVRGSGQVKIYLEPVGEQTGP